MSDTETINLDAKLQELLKLPPAKRIELAERLIESVPPFPDEETELAWKDEIARRIEEVDQGRVKLIPAEEVMKEARERINEIRSEASRSET